MKLTKTEIARLKEGLLMHTEKLLKMKEAKFTADFMQAQIDRELLENNDILKKLNGDVTSSRKEVASSSGLYNLNEDLSF